MELLKSLGINSTLWIHVACFAVAYLSLSNFLFKPYAKALRERESRTVGNEERATRMLNEAVEINTEYEQKAKSVSAAIRTEYDKSRAEALHEYDKVVTHARAEAAKALDHSRELIATELGKAKTLLAQEIPSVTSTIASKMAGKEISL
ncbi:MAG: ATP synthase F0 subunit B [Bdellovibrionales bacterium]|jgi:F-type H+-transporting ATPase subunit b|nr:ATP synthase F0 subunit B [Bdellovibrionales bacterium]